MTKALLTLLLLAMTSCAGTSQLQFLSETHSGGCEPFRKFETSKGSEINCCKDSNGWLCYELAVQEVNLGEIYLSTPPIPRTK